MRLKHLTIAGFRGFNTERRLDFHHALTLISAPNSHGKTSITEALEFLLYGQTSKVASADSKEEYKDSYENRHYSSASPVFVEAHCTTSQSDDVTVLRVELDDQGFRRFVNGTLVLTWPFEADLASAAKPFVVQHALKTLLLAAPSERFQGFARLLGLQDIDTIQQALVNLCTKPEAHLSPQARKLLSELSTFDSRLRVAKETVPIAKALSGGPDSVEEAFAKIHARGVSLLGKQFTISDMPSALVALRNAAASKVFAGSVAIKDLSSVDLQRASVSAERIARTTRKDFFDEYSRLAVGDTSERMRKELRFMGLGLELIDQTPNQCPFCEQIVNEDIRKKAHKRHAHLTTSIGTGPDLSTLRANILRDLKELISNLNIHSSIQLGRTTDLIQSNTPESSQKIKALFGKGNESSLFLVASAGAAITPSHKALTSTVAGAIAAAEVSSDAIHKKSEDLAHIEALVTAVTAYLQTVEAYDAKLREVAPTLADPTVLLQQAVDSQAGTTELSLLIEMLSSRTDIGRAVRLRATLTGLKDLKKHIDQAVGETMETAFSSDLTGAVMEWYKRIRTTGDPDVHFSGFSMERTKTGDFKNRRVRVAAHSYGVELASAVSSLSESKLNALGLCMSIATALRAPGPWDFLVLDDPIQSWDDDHEFQFIEIIRELAEKADKQIVLMSHREKWIDQVVGMCRSLNGLRYHITGYTKDGPTIHMRDWDTIDHRLKEVLTICKDSSATPVRLQQAEEEIRIIACQLASEIAKTKLNRDTGAHKLNADKARSILNEAGCPVLLIDKVIGTFATTDDAHHVPEDYVPNAQRIRKYHASLTELRNWARQ